jgi:hypothetical protein
MTRAERVEELKVFIKEEFRFEKLYSRLLDEIELEKTIDPNYKTNHFLNNLRQTKEKQAEIYLMSKRKDKSREFNDFLNAFSQDLVYGKLLADQFPNL